MWPLGRCYRTQFGVTVWCEALPNLRSRWPAGPLRDRLISVHLQFILVCSHRLVNYLTNCRDRHVIRLLKPSTKAVGQNVCSLGV